MKLIVKGVPYDLMEAIAGAHMQTLKVLQLSSKLSGGFDMPAVTPKSIMRCIATIAEKSDVEGFDPLDLLSDIDFMHNLQGIVFLARRKNGEQITFDDAGDFSIPDIAFDAPDAGADVGDAADPKEASALPPTSTPQ